MFMFRKYTLRVSKTVGTIGAISLGLSYPYTINSNSDSNDNDDDNVRERTFSMPPQFKINSSSYPHHTIHPPVLKNNEDDEKEEEKSDGVLQQVVVICRHGDRTPIGAADVLGGEDAAYQEELWRALLPSKHDEYTWNSVLPVKHLSHNEHVNHNQTHKFPYGELTLLGVVEARRLGYTLRDRYIHKLHFLPTHLYPFKHTDEISPDDISSSTSFPFFLRTTNYNRTRQTLQNLMFGLYPELLSSTISHESPLHLVTVHGNEERLYPNTKDCCRQREIIQQYRQQLREKNAKEPEVCHLLSKVRNHLHLEDHERIPFGWTRIYEVLTCQTRYNLPLALGLNQEDRQLIQKLTVASWESWSNTKEMQRLAMGRLLQEIQEHMTTCVEKNSKAPKLVIYSGHDSTLIPLLQALDGFNNKWPSYASNIVLELWQDNEKDHFIRFYFNGEEQPLFGCVLKNGCSWKHFNKNLKQIIPTDYTQECSCIEGEHSH